MTIVTRNHAHRRSEDTAQRTTVVYASRDAEQRSKHERETHHHIARGLAALQGYEFGGSYDATVDYLRPLYLVPAATLTDCETARRLGVAGDDDLFGGVVPYKYMATKTITHPLVDNRAFKPKGWSEAFPARVAGATLFGFSAFTVDDARRAGAWVLERGPARIKRGDGVGGRGQSVACDMRELNDSLGSVSEPAIADHGLVIEQNLEHVTTFSIGQVRIGNLIASYHGKQRLTEDNHGSKVYGGSDLIVVRGDYDQLTSLNLSPEVRLAIEQARAYDAAANEIPVLSPLVGTMMWRKAWTLRKKGALASWSNPGELAEQVPPNWPLS